MRAPRRPRARWFTSSRCTSAPRRPRLVENPSDTIVSDRVERGPFELRGTATPAHQREQFVLGAIAAGAFRDDLLGEDVERRVVLHDRVQVAAPHRAQQGQRLDQIVARHRQNAPFRHAGERVAGSADALQKRRDPVRRSDLAHEIHVADVDAELERRGRDQRPQLAVLQPRFRVETALLGQAAVMRGDRILAEALAQVPGHALGQPPRVHEDQRRPVSADELGEAVVVLLARSRATSPLRAETAAARAADPARGGVLRPRSRSRRARPTR